MGFEYYGVIRIENLPTGEKAIENVISILLEDRENNNFEHYKQEGYIEQLSITDNELVADGGGSYDDMSAYNDIFYCVCDEITHKYPDCNMKAHFSGSNMNSDSEWIFAMDYNNHHVRRIDFEGISEIIFCPNQDCEEEIFSLGDYEFDKDYECEYCGRKITATEAQELVEEFVEEYDIP